MDSAGFWVALGVLESLPSDSVEAFVAAWNVWKDGLTEAINRLAAWCPAPCSVRPSSSLD